MPVSSPSLQFKIIDETGDYIVIDKPPFLLSHPTKPTTQPTLWKELRELLAFEIAGGGQVSIVNRLDRETSGLVLVAKTAAAARKFGLLMQQQKVHKEYLATVWGWPNWERKTVDAPLDRQGKHQPSAIWLKRTIHPHGAPAETEFRVERRFAKRSVASSSAASRLPLPGQEENESEDRKKFHANQSAPTSSFTCVLLRRGGHLNSSNGYSCHVMRFIRRNWQSKASENGRVHYLLTLLSSSGSDHFLDYVSHAI